MSNLDYFCADLDEAMDKYAVLLVRRENQRASMYGGGLDNSPVNNSEPSDEDKEKLAELDREMKKMKESFISYPQVRDHIRCFMVDIWANEGCLTQDLINIVFEHPSALNLHEALKRGSNLYTTTREVIENAGYNVTDSGGGCGGWHLGVYCTWEKATGLCDMLHDLFSPLIAEGVFLIQWHLDWSMDVGEIRDLKSALERCRERNLL